MSLRTAATRTSRAAAVVALLALPAIGLAAQQPATEGTPPIPTFDKTETMVAMRDGVIPPTINVDEPDPNCDLDYVPDVGRKLQVEHAVANCIAFGSKNSAMLLRRV